MRGALDFIFSFGGISGIIPAYAGSTRSGAACRPCWWDHPRVCGEHRPADRRRHQPTGSSPRMRGARSTDARHAYGHGIIPAYAGSTLALFVACVLAKDHPRVCGEHNIQLDVWQSYQGSSPRMRGALAFHHRRAQRLGIIPAYAGSTDTTAGRRSSCWDHPRVCGEHELSMPRKLTNSGSSPRMRGAHADRLGEVPQPGIIPAYAGSTATTTIRCAPCRDHPRVCGEHGSKTMPPGWHEGSSPRMRGARSTERAFEPVAGIIPAYAGST